MLELKSFVKLINTAAFKIYTKKLCHFKSHLYMEKTATNSTKNLLLFKRSRIISSHTYNVFCIALIILFPTKYDHDMQVHADTLGLRAFNSTRGEFENCCSRADISKPCVQCRESVRDKSGGSALHSKMMNVCRQS